MATQPSSTIRPTARSGVFYGERKPRSTRYRTSVRIPAKANSVPEGSRTGFRAGPEQQSERSDAGFLIVQEVFGLVKVTDVPEEVRSEAEAGDSELGKGCGERDSSPVPRSVLERPDGGLCTSSALLAHRVALHLNAVGVVD